MEATKTYSIALIGTSSSWASKLSMYFDAEVQLEVCDMRMALSPQHTCYFVEIKDLMALSSDARLSLVAEGVINTNNLVILEEDKLLFAPKSLVLPGFDSALSAVFKPKLPKIRNPLIPQLWAQLMSEPEVLACQRLCKQLHPESHKAGIGVLLEELRMHMHLIQDTQELLKELLQQLSKHKVVSWEARQLLDSANALLMVHSLTAVQDFSHRMEQDENEYGQLVQQTFCKFAEQLSAALFRYNESMAFHWFFTEQKIHLPSAV
jgi:hypothetical protein